MNKELMDKEIFSTNILIICCAVFFISLFISIYFSEKLSEKIAIPIKKISEILKFKPELGKKIKFPEPENLEMKILILEFNEMWYRLSELNKFNIRNLKYKDREVYEIVNFYSNGILALSEINKVLYYNSAMKKILEVDAYEMKGNNWYDLSISSKNYLIIRDIIRKGEFEEKNIKILLTGREFDCTIRRKEVKDYYGVLNFILFELIINIQGKYFIL